jgi:hypothetical protein
MTPPRPILRLEGLAVTFSIVNDSTSPILRLEGLTVTIGFTSDVSLTATLA